MIIEIRVPSFELALVSHPVRSKLNDIVEMASLPCVSVKEQQTLLHIVVVGGGPIGVEISAEMTELIHNDFNALHPNFQGEVFHCDL